MVKLFVMHGYQISIWSSEVNEPIHIYISKRKPTVNSPKLWMTRDGYFIKANISTNDIPSDVLDSIRYKLTYNSNIVKHAWLAYHGYERYAR